MSRAPRIEYEGAVYHVINRGVERRIIFSVPQDHAAFLGILEDLKRRYKAELLAYCLMPNHYHLLLRTALCNLNRFMMELNGSYSKRYNRRCRRVGPLFQGRYRAIVVQAGERMLDVARYIHLNPVKAGLEDRPEAYAWSSYRQYVFPGARGIVDAGYLLDYMDASEGRARRLFRAFTLASHEEEYDPDKAKGGVISGAVAFVEWVRRERISRTRKREVAKWADLKKPGPAVVKSMEERISDLADSPKLRKKLLVYALKKATPFLLDEIAALTGKKTAIAVTQVVRRLELAAEEDPVLAQTLATLDSRLRAKQK